MSIRDKLLKSSTIKLTSMLADSVVYSKKEFVQTKVPMVNVALSGRIDGGLTSGLTMLAGPSKHFKTGFALLLASAYLQKYEDAFILFYDSEFGTPQAYFDTFGIPSEKVIHTPVTDIEELKHDISVQLQTIDRKDRVIIIIDSIGNLASKKETDDAMDGNSVADMSRAKALKSLFRIVTPKLSLKDIPLVAINHTYMEIGRFPKTIVGGGCVDGNTEIIMADRSLKKMCEIQIGEFVHTLEGPREVTHVWTPETLMFGNPKRYKVTFEDGYEAIVSDEHKFLIGENWVGISDIEIGTDVVSAP